MAWLRMTCRSFRQQARFEEYCYIGKASFAGKRGGSACMEAWKAGVASWNGLQISFKREGKAGGDKGPHRSRQECRRVREEPACTSMMLVGCNPTAVDSRKCRKGTCTHTNHCLLSCILSSLSITIRNSLVSFIACRCQAASQEQFNFDCAQVAQREMFEFKFKVDGIWKLANLKYLEDW